MSGILVQLDAMWRHVVADSDSRRIFIFLSINLAFMCVEISYGVYANSLGLISDAGHMLFDCVALGIGLYASFLSKLRPTAVYTYGCRTSHTHIHTQVRALRGPGRVRECDFPYFHGILHLRRGLRGANITILFPPTPTFPSPPYAHT